jgi:hypothetical protein
MAPSAGEDLVLPRMSNQSIYDTLSQHWPVNPGEAGIVDTWYHYMPDFTWLRTGYFPERSANGNKEGEKCQYCPQSLL